MQKENRKKVRVIKGKYDILSNIYEGEYNYRGLSFNSLVQGIEWKKAKLFPTKSGDNQTIALKERKPIECKKKVSEVTKGYNHKVFLSHLSEYYKDLILAKAQSNKEFKEELLKTEGIIVYAHDKDWELGSGLHRTNPNNDTPSRWLGKNIYGKSLMEVREQLKG